LFSDEPHVHYGQIYVHSDVDSSTILEDCFAGQDSGLCGASVPGTLFLITGLHTGKVGFTVEWHAAEPPLDDAWEDVVEASFQPESARVVLREWGGGAWELDLPKLAYRVRYCASGMDEGHAADTRMDGEPLIDRYLLQFWPSSVTEGRVVRQTSKYAAYWHEAASKFPSADELALRRHEAYLADERRAQEEAEERARQQLQREVLLWRGKLPSDRLRAAGGNALQLAVADRDLVDAIEHTDPDRQRMIARAAVHRAYLGAELAGIDWIAEGLAALDRGGDLPAAFDNMAAAFNRLFDDPRVPRTIVPGSGNYSRQAMAFPAIFQALQEDPLRSALDTVWTAVFSYGTDRKDVLDEIRGLLE
jgi:hypothetical protein